MQIRAIAHFHEKGPHEAALNQRTPAARDAPLRGATGLLSCYQLIGVVVDDVGHFTFVDTAAVVARKTKTIAGQSRQCHYVAPDNPAPNHSLKRASAPNIPMMYIYVP